MNISTKQLALYAMFLVFAIILSYLERMIPPIIPSLPGIKLGFANIIVLLLLYLRGYASAFMLNILRVVLTGLLFTGIFAALYASAGALLSFAFISLFKRSGIFGVVGVSVIGAVSHNLGQLSLAVLILANAKLFLYLPVLMLSGIISGIAIGYIAGVFLNRAAKISRI